MFHTKKPAFSVSQIASHLGLEAPDVVRDITGVAALETASATELSFLDNVKYISALSQTQACAVIVSQKYVDKVPNGVIALVSEYPYADYAKVLQMFYPERTSSGEKHASAVLAGNAQVPASVQVGPHAVIEAGAVIGENVIIEAGAIVGENVHIGTGSIIGRQAVVTHALIGKNCIIHPHASIGQDGFGFAYDGKQVVKVPQIGHVEIGDFVEIGAGTTVDRGSLKNTLIGDFTKIDNLVQIAHNVQIGRGCQIVSQVGIAGSTVLGDGCIVGGQAGIVGHINLVSGTTIAARSGVTKSVVEPGVYSGFPAVPMREWRRMQAGISRLLKNEK